MGEETTYFTECETNGIPRSISNISSQTIELPENCGWTLHQVISKGISWNFLLDVGSGLNKTKNDHLRLPEIIRSKTYLILPFKTAK